MRPIRINKENAIFEVAANFLFDRSPSRILFSFLLFLGACSSVSVYQPNDPPGSPSGAVTPFNTYISSNVTNIKLVFIHGVGDHCPGYALGDAGSWFSAEQAIALGFRPNDPKPIPDETIYSSEFLSLPDAKVPHPFDPESYVKIRTKNFTYGANNIHVEAIELTWSPLTQWIKNDRLADDRTDSSSFSCPTPQKESADSDEEVKAQPPSRLVLNRVLKEEVLDRELADAAIYMGQYHTTMQLGLADGLCHALTGQPVIPSTAAKPGPVCDWRRASVDPSTQYIFVTHSLGSRLLYDSILGLLHLDVPGVDQTIFANEFPGSDSYMLDMMARTPVIYMMANQLTFLGMANITADDNSQEAAYKPAIVLADHVEAKTPATLEAAQHAISNCNNVLCRLAIAESVARAKAQGPSKVKLDVVAFSDTDDLLSWSIPTEYQRAVDGLPLSFTNIYVQNSPRILVLEWPPSAHSDYFFNPDVWNVIYCGAANGRPKNCTH